MSDVKFRVGNYIVCTDCGKVYDTNDSWQLSDHADGTCTNIQQGFCDSCGGMGELHTANSGETVHKDLTACILTLREQLRYTEQHNLEHDARYCELEKAVRELTEGRKAALEESRTLKAIRENADAAVSS